MMPAEISDLESEAFMLGVEAAEDGQPVSANPYNPVDPNCRRWLAGYKSGSIPVPVKIDALCSEPEPIWKCLACGFSGEPRGYVIRRGMRRFHYEACPKCDKSRRVY